jgi:hypothetical protein
MSRHARFLELIDTRAEGRQVDFARMIGRSPALVWQYVSRHREIGEKFARHVEAKLSLPKGWMDDLSSGPAPAAPPRLSTLLDRIAERISEDGTREIDDALGLIELFMRETDQAKRAKLAKILDDLASQSEQSGARRQAPRGATVAVPK